MPLFSLCLLSLGLFRLLIAVCIKFLLELEEHISFLPPVRTIRKLVVQRTQLEDFLSAHRGITSGHYFRLMGLAGMDIVFTIPLGAFIIYLNASRTPIQQWVSWANIHSDFQLIEQFPSVVWHQDQLTVAGIELTRYTVVFCAFLFFAFFGFADEARRNYRIVYTSFTRGVGLSTERDFSGTYSGAGSVVLLA